MPAPHGPNARHERNLERVLEGQTATVGSVTRGGVPAAGGDSGSLDVAAKLAREAAEREAARRGGERRGGGGGGP